MKIIVLNNEIEIHNVTHLNEFNDKEFNITIDNNPYLIKGENLVLKDFYDNNTSIKITGEIYLIERKNKKAKDNKGFIKKLFS